MEKPGEAERRWRGACRLGGGVGQADVSEEGAVQELSSAWEARAELGTAEGRSGTDCADGVAGR